MAKVEMLDKVLAAFEKYIENTVGEYGDSRMFDCGVQEARKVIEQAKKVGAGKKTLTGVPHNRLCSGVQARSGCRRKGAIS